MRIYYVKWKSLVILIVFLLLIIRVIYHYYYNYYFSNENKRQERFLMSLKANLTNEIDIYAYSAFTFNVHFPAEQGIYKRNVETLSGQRKVDLHRVVYYTSEKLSLKWIDFHMGFYRVTPLNGYQYQLHFKSVNNSTCCRTVNLKKIYKNEYEIDDETIMSLSTKEMINLIMPLWGDKVVQLKNFLKMFHQVSLRDNQIYSTLTIVYLYEPSNSFDQENKKRIDNLVKKSSIRIRIIFVESQIKSRGRALQIGAEAVHGLLLFIDVDIVINQEFLHYCRANTILNKKVFYPILFSFYNPKIVAKFDRDALLMQENLLIKKDTGFWRDIGFGMSCQYKNDFLSVNGFNEFIDKSTWGDEDLALYRKYVQYDQIEIVRAIIPGIFHLHHFKKCDYDVSNMNSYINCIQSKVLNEASHKHLGFLYFNFSQINN